MILNISYKKSPPIPILIRPDYTRLIPKTNVQKYQNTYFYLKHINSWCIKVTCN